MMMTPEENMDDPDVFIPISEEILSELSSIDSYTVSNMAKELSMLRSEVRRLRAIEEAARQYHEAASNNVTWSQKVSDWDQFTSALAAMEGDNGKA
jgi:hypothetical protein